MGSQDIALGFRTHTGWATVVALRGFPGDFQILVRRRIELLPADPALPRFAYHQAAELTPPKAAKLVAGVRQAATECAAAAVRTLVEELRGSSRSVAFAGIPRGTTRVPQELQNILRAHSLIHAAEGELFQQALIAAAEGCGLSVVQARERDLWLKLAEAYGTEEADLRTLIDGHRRVAGSPWAMDQKIAAAVALLALAALPGSHQVVSSRGRS